MKMVKVIINQGLQVKYKFCGINLKYKKKKFKDKVDDVVVYVQ